MIDYFVAPWDRHTPQFAPPVWWGDPQMRAYCEAQAAQDPVRERALIAMYANAARQHQAGAPLERQDLGPNQLAWCRDNLRGFAMEDKAC